MENAYQPEAWHDLYIMLGSAAAVLVGLLFVVITLHLGEIRNNPHFNTAATIHAARNNTLHLLTVMVETALVLTPQPAAILGAELVALNLYGLRLPVGFTYRWFNKNIRFAEHRGFPADIIATIFVSYLLGIAGGIALIEDESWGLYLLTASCLVILVRSVLTAWALMFGVGETETKTPAD